MTHADEIKYWAEHQDGTRVWWKYNNGSKWYSTTTPAWSMDKIYVVDDEWAELRKAQEDGKQLQYLSFSGKWIDDTLDYSKMTLMLKNWRIKPEEQVYEYQVIYKIGRKGIFHITSEYHKDKEEFTEKRGELIFIGMYEPSKRIRK